MAGKIIEEETTRIGTDKLCPVRQGGGGLHPTLHCLDACEWNDGEGCAVWRIVKALEKIANAQAPMERR